MNEIMKTEKIFIVRQKMDWHNCDPEDGTMAFRNVEDAKQCMNKVFNEMKSSLKKRDRDFYDEKLAVDYGYIVTTADDYYNCWVEEICLK